MTSFAILKSTVVRKQSREGMARVLSSSSAGASDSGKSHSTRREMDKDTFPSNGFRQAPEWGHSGHRLRVTVRWHGHKSFVREMKLDPEKGHTSWSRLEHSGNRMNKSEGSTVSVSRTETTKWIKSVCTVLLHDFMLDISCKQNQFHQ